MIWAPFFCCIFEAMETHIIIIYCILAVVTLVTIWGFFRGSKIRRKKEDKTPEPNHKYIFKPPTWRFQKFHPAVCPHKNGIYRKVEMRQLDKTVKKTIFVCADCVSTIETEELEHRDKFQ